MANDMSYYLGLFTSEYQNKPNLRATAVALLNYLFDIDRGVSSIDPSFDIDQAVGVQLDILGTIIGASRTVGFQPSGGISPVLDDDTYRLLLKATIAANQWDGTIDGMQAAWASLFPIGQIVIIDNQNMTLDVTLTGSFSSIVQDLIQNGYIVPKPQAVGINYHFGTLPMFGFDRQDSYIAGFDTGNWNN